MQYETDTMSFFTVLAFHWYVTLGCALCLLLSEPRIATVHVERLRFRLGKKWPRVHLLRDPHSHTVLAARNYQRSHA